MRVIIYGAGAIGGVMGAQLFRQGNDVTFIARGDNFAALARDGIRLETPAEAVTLRVPVVGDPAELSFGSDDLVILAFKSQDTMGALRRLAGVAPASTGIVCAQNGVENERMALRVFSDVYGMCVMCPATHLTPGVVQASSAPVTGLLDVGRWPQGIDEHSLEIASVLGAVSFDSVAREDIARWKWGKLLMNLGNAVEAVCGAQGRGGELVGRALKEGVQVLRHAGIGFVDQDEDSSRRGALLKIGAIGGAERAGGSSWQSLARATGEIETDYLSGEIVLQGRLHDFPTPVNELLRRLANEMAAQRRAPGAWSEDEVLAMLTSG
jgi:2-dehydropantoate 2-reductase